MIAPGAGADWKKKRYRIPLGRKKTSTQAIGFQAAMLKREETRRLLFAPAEKHLMTIAPTGAGKVSFSSRT